MRIILIDDDRHYLKFLSMFLDSKGHEVLTASDPTEFTTCDHADDGCRHTNTCGDILLIDQNMPKMTGLEFIQQQINRGCKGSVCNTALMSANLTRNERELATRLGCTIFNKPFHLRALNDWIDTVETHLSSEQSPNSFSINLHHGVMQ